jgi:Ceramidase
MDWTQQVFNYCERGSDAAFWAEPVNALTNAAFAAASLYGYRLWLQRPPGQRGTFELALIILVALIAAGSFAFHTLATRWAAVADAAPIAIFMAAYVVYAIRRFLAGTWLQAALGVAVLFALMPLAQALPCPGGPPCYNGSAGYLPALAMLAGIGLLALRRRHPAGRLLLWAAAVFALSLTARTLDRDICAATAILGQVRGTHGLWHLLNALVLALLLRAAIQPCRHNAQ